MLDYNFIAKEINEFVSYCNKDHLCIHIESVNLSDGVYEMVPASDHTPESAVLNLTKLDQDPGQSPEEPKASSAQEGKPWCI